MYQKTNDLIPSAISLIQGERNLVANLANLSALINDFLPDVNWVGFYLWNEEDQELVLGPFQGKPACIRIKAQRGVCGKAYTTKETQLVADVHAFPGHIACDSQTNSELVIPIVKGGICLGVLDLDSPQYNRFSFEEAKLFEDLINKVIPILWPC